MVYQDFIALLEKERAGTLNNCEKMRLKKRQGENLLAAKAAFERQRLRAKANRQKYITGGAVFEDKESDAYLENWHQNKIRNLQRDRDRQTFDLPPLPKEPDKVILINSYQKPRPAYAAKLCKKKAQPIK